jgi:DNA primase
VDRGRALFDITSSEGKAHGVAFLFPYLETLESEVSRDSCVGAIADAFGVDRTAVRKDFEKRREPRKSTTSSNETIEKREVRMNDELFLMMAAVTNPSLYPTVRAELSIEEVQDPRAKELFIALEESFREDSLGMDSLLSRIEDGDLRAFMLQHSASEAFSTQPEKLVFDGIKRIKEKRLQRRRAEIVLKLRTARNEGMGTDRQLDDLLSEKVHIDAELLRLKEDHE